MSRYCVLLRFTQQRLAEGEDSAVRAEALQRIAAQMRARIEGQHWTTGPYDGA